MGIAITSGVIASLESAQTILDEALPRHAIPDSLSDIDSSIPSHFLVTCTSDSTARKLRNLFQDLGRFGESVGVIKNGNVEAVKRADVVLLWYAQFYFILYILRRNVLMLGSCKPYQAQTIMNEEGMKDALHKKLLISILAGVKITQLRNWVTPETRVIRAMPNTPCMVLIYTISHISHLLMLLPRDTPRNDGNLKLPSKLSHRDFRA